MITMFYINHEFWYQFHLDQLKNVDIFGRLNIYKWTGKEAAIL